MLQKIHERVQGVIAWVLIILIAVTFTLWGINYYLESHTTSDVQAEVNGEEISKTDFSGTYQRLKHQAESQTGELSSAQEKMLKQRALKQLIFTRTVLQGAQKAGYLVTREQAQQALMQIPQFQEDGLFSAEKFQQAMSSALYTPSIFLTKIQEGLVINQQRFSFAGTAFVLPDEMSRFIGLSRQTRDLEYFVLPEKAFEKNITISSQELKSYYKENKNQFRTPEKVSINYIVVDIKKILSRTQVSNQMTRNYYYNNIDAYTHPAQWQWAHILVRIPPGARKSVVNKAYQKALNIEKMLDKKQDFSLVAKKNSDDVLSAAKGGVTPWTSALSMNPDILTVLRRLKNNQVSPPIRTKYGYEIIKRLGFISSKKIPLYEVRKQIVDTLKMDKAQQIFAQMGDDLTNLSYQNPYSLKEVAKELELPVKTTPFFTRKGLPSGIASYKEVVQAAFSDEVLEEHNNSALLAINDDLLVVLRVRKHTEQSFMAFDKVKPVIEKQIKKAKASMEAQRYAEKLIICLEKPDAKSEMIKESQKKYHWIWHAHKNIQRDNVTLNQSIVQTLFEMPMLLKNSPNYKGVTLANGDYAVLKLNQVRPGSTDSLDHEERKMFKDEIDASLGIVDYNLYVEGLMRQAKIVEHAK